MRHHSVDTALEVTAYALEHREQFSELVALVAGDDDELARRAAWAMGKAGEGNPHWFAEHLPLLLPLLSEELHPAIARNIYRALQYCVIEEAFQAQLFDLCLLELSRAKRPAAIKVFAMTVAFNIAIEQEALKDELRLAIEDNLGYGSAGFLNRGKKILRKLE